MHCCANVVLIQIGELGNQDDIQLQSSSSCENIYEVNLVIFPARCSGVPADTGELGNLFLNFFFLHDVHSRLQGERDGGVKQH